MRLRGLELENFRCFTKVELEFGMGLIGVRGRNGVGKTSLLEATDFALYGQRHGLPSHRSGAGPGERLRVYVELDIDAHKVEVERTSDDAWLSVDGGPRIQGREAVTKHVAALLQLSRKQFDATFYARQKEVQSFADPTTRRASIERLLGLTQLREATKLARERARDQLVVVQTLEEDAADVDEVKRVLAERREEVKRTAPIVGAARDRRDELQEQRAEAWEAFEAAQQQLTAVQQARAEQGLAAQRHQAAQQQHQSAVEALQAAEQAAAETKRLAPAAAKVPELEARIREFETRRQAHEQYLNVREARADAQRRHASATDRLQELPAPEVSAEELTATMTAERARSQALAQVLLETTEKLAVLAEQHREAERQAKVTSRLQELEPQLEAVAGAQDEEERCRTTLSSLSGTQTEAAHQLEAERAHREDVRRDGPDATCVRCRRAYGDSHEVILAEFDAGITSLERRLGELERESERARVAHAAARARVWELQRLEGERDTLIRGSAAAALPLAQAAKALTEGKAHQAQLRRDVQAADGRVGALEKQAAVATEQGAARQRVSDEIAALRLEQGLLDKQLKGMRDEGYDEEAHAQATSEHHRVHEAAQRCAELRQRAEGRELAERRCGAAEKALEEAALKLQHADQHLTAQGNPEDQLEEAQQRLRELDKVISEAEEALVEAERRATSEDQQVKSAEAAMKEALGDRRKIQAARREQRYADATADGLARYTAHRQAGAVPTLEKETASFLSRLTDGRYTDVRLDDKGGLEVYDDGEPRPLRRFSGGEQDLANLCLRLALSRTLAERQSADPRLIILDEVFGSQDVDRRQLLLEHLRELERVFSQVFIVSHFDDVADACDVQVEVRRKGKLSTAQLVG
jgi:exonuclease SbcC